ncbi:MAG: response regulator [Planctomycetota bacterium]|jgi:two-component system chemotaxis response regulator CheY
MADAKRLNGDKPKVLDVGECGFDHGNISRMLSEEFSADVERVDTSEGAFRAIRAGQYDLVLVNRVLDSDGTSGLDLIQRLQSHEETRSTPVMLVSNYAKAQDVAVALGAERGFGKAALASSDTRGLLVRLLGDNRRH